MGGEQATSTIYWTKADAPVKENLSNPHDAEVAAVRRYIENQSVCRRVQLLSYFDPAIVSIYSLSRMDPTLCCDSFICYHASNC